MSDIERMAQKTRDERDERARREQEDKVLQEAPRGTCLRRSTTWVGVGFGSYWVIYVTAMSTVPLIMMVHHDVVSADIVKLGVSSVAAFALTTFWLYPFAACSRARSWAASLPFKTNYPEFLGVRKAYSVGVAISFDDRLPDRALMVDAVASLKRTWVTVEKYSNSALTLTIQSDGSMTRDAYPNHNYRLNRRFRRIVKKFLMPLHQDYPIENVKVTVELD